MPKPAQKPHPPIWIGASTEGGFRRAAKWADGLCSSPRHHLSDLKNHYASYRRYLKEFGRKEVCTPVIREVYCAETMKQVEEKGSGGFADPVFAPDVDHSGAALRLAQGPQDLLFRMSLLRHLRVLLDLVHRTTLAAQNSTYRWLAFRVLGQPVRILFRAERRGLCPPGRECLRRVVR